VNQLAQQASIYIVSQGFFWVASVSLVEHRYALRSKGKLILEDSYPLRGKQKPILGNAKSSYRVTRIGYREKKLMSGRIESEPRKIEASFGK
jgi:hypothetical protein